MRKARKDAMDGGVIAVPDSRGWGPARRDTPIQHSSFRKIFSMKTQTSAINRDAASIHVAARNGHCPAAVDLRPKRGKALLGAVAGLGAWADRSWARA